MFFEFVQVEYLPVIYPNDNHKQNAARLSQKVCAWWRYTLFSCICILFFMANISPHGILVNTDKSCNCSIFECRPNISFLWGLDATQ